MCSTYSGEVAYPEYIELWHEAALGDAVVTAPTSTFISSVNTALAANPYDTYGSVYNPDTDIDAIQADIDNYKALLPQSELDIWEAMYQRADALVSTASTAVTDEIDTLSTEFAKTRSADRASSYNRTLGAFVDINGIWSTSMAMALNVIEVDDQARVSALTSQATLESAIPDSRTRAIMLMQSVSEMTGILSTKVNQAQVGAQLQDGQGRFSITAKNEEVQRQLTVGADGAMYDIGVLQQGAAGIGAISGIAAGSPKPSPLQSIIMGAGNSVALGAQIGMQSGSAAVGVGVGLAGIVASIAQAQGA